MKTARRDYQMKLGHLGNREVVANFKGGIMTSDSGTLLLREANDMFRITHRLAQCFVDHRDSIRTEHSTETLIAQRVFEIALGYEDVNDHNDLRKDSALALALNLLDITGADRSRERDRGNPLAGSSTLNRMELGDSESEGKDRYKKIVADTARIDALIVALFLEQFEQAPETIILDLDTTDDLLHGNQEGKHYHGHYQAHCYLPLYITCGQDVLCCRLRPSHLSAADGVVEELERIVDQIRKRWPKTTIIVRGDGAFSTDEIMSWCEANQLKYVFGLAKNKRLLAQIESQLAQAKKDSQATGERARVFRRFTYRTLRSWSGSRQVIGKAEWLPEGPNPRFVVTNLNPQEYSPQELYEEVYCARGDMENRIKEMQLDLFADRTSTAYLRSNQLRLYFSVFASILMRIIKKYGLTGTPLETATSGTIRTQLFKIAGVVKVSVRRYWMTISSIYPRQKLFCTIVKNLKAALRERQRALS